MSVNKRSVLDKITLIGIIATAQWLITMPECPNPNLKTMGGVLHRLCENYVKLKKGAHQRLNELILIFVGELISASVGPSRLLMVRLVCVCVRLTTNSVFRRPE